MPTKKNDREFKPRKQKQEVCSNPFKNGKCRSPDIALYIEFKGQKYPICRRCWEKLISNSDLEWGGCD